MPKNLIRIVAFLLVPCLTLDPALGAVGGIPSHYKLPNNQLIQFNINALAPLALGENQTAMDIEAGHVNLSLGKLIRSNQVNRKPTYQRLGLSLLTVASILFTTACRVSEAIRYPVSAYQQVYARYPFLTIILIPSAALVAITVAIFAGETLYKVIWHPVDLRWMSHTENLPRLLTAKQLTTEQSKSAKLARDIYEALRHGGLRLDRSSALRVADAMFAAAENDVHVLEGYYEHSGPDDWPSHGSSGYVLGPTQTVPAVSDLRNFLRDIQAGRFTGMNADQIIWTLTAKGVAIAEASNDSDRIGIKILSTVPVEPNVGQSEDKPPMITVLSTLPYEEPSVQRQEPPPTETPVIRLGPALAAFERLKSAYKEFIGNEAFQKIPRERVRQRITQWLDLPGEATLEQMTAALEARERIRNMIRVLPSSEHDRPSLSANAINQAIAAYAQLENAYRQTVGDEAFGKIPANYQRLRTLQWFNLPADATTQEMQEAYAKYDEVRASIQFLPVSPGKQAKEGDAIQIGKTYTIVPAGMGALLPFPSIPYEGLGLGWSDGEHETMGTIRWTNPERRGLHDWMVVDQNGKPIYPCFGWDENNAQVFHYGEYDVRVLRDPAGDFALFITPSKHSHGQILLEKPRSTRNPGASHSGSWWDVITEQGMLVLSGVLSLLAMSMLGSAGIHGASQYAIALTVGMLPIAFLIEPFVEWHRPRFEEVAASRDITVDEYKTYLRRRFVLFALATISATIFVPHLSFLSGEGVGISVHALNNLFFLPASHTPWLREETDTKKPWAKAKQDVLDDIRNFFLHRPVKADKTIIHVNSRFDQFNGKLIYFEPSKEQLEEDVRALSKNFELERLENLLYEGQDVIPQVSFKLIPAIRNQDYQLEVLHVEGRVIVGLGPTKSPDYQLASEWVVTISFRKNGTAAVGKARQEAAEAVRAYEKYADSLRESGKVADWFAANDRWSEAQNEAVVHKVLPGNKSRLKHWVIAGLHVRVRTQMMEVHQEYPDLPAAALYLREAYNAIDHEWGRLEMPVPPRKQAVEEYLNTVFEDPKVAQLQEADHDRPIWKVGHAKVRDMVRNVLWYNSGYPITIKYYPEFDRSGETLRAGLSKTRPIRLATTYDSGFRYLGGISYLGTGVTVRQVEQQLGLYQFLEIDPDDTVSDMKQTTTLQEAIARRYGSEVKISVTDSGYAREKIEKPSYSSTISIREDATVAELIAKLREWESKGELRPLPTAIRPRDEVYAATRKIAEDFARNNHPLPTNGPQSPEWTLYDAVKKYLTDIGLNPEEPELLARVLSHLRYVWAPEAIGVFLNGTSSRAYHRSNAEKLAVSA